MLALVLVQAVAPTGAPAQLKSANVHTHYDVRVGDQFVYKVTETKPGRKKKKVTTSRTISETVVDLSAAYEEKAGARRMIRDTVTGRSVYYLAQPGQNFSINEPAALSDMRAAGGWKTYPLVISKGKSIKLPESETTVDLGSSKSMSTTGVTLSLLGKETIRVGKLRLKCTKILETITVKSYTMSGTKKLKPKTKVKKAYVWYSPELQTLAKYTVSEDGKTFTQTLQKYVPAPKATASN